MSTGYYDQDTGACSAEYSNCVQWEGFETDAAYGGPGGIWNRDNPGSRPRRERGGPSVRERYRPGQAPRVPRRGVRRQGSAPGMPFGADGAAENVAQSIAIAVAVVALVAVVSL